MFLRLNLSENNVLFAVSHDAPPRALQFKLGEMDEGLREDGRGSGTMTLIKNNEPAASRGERLVHVKQSCHPNRVEISNVSEACCVSPVDPGTLKAVVCSPSPAGAGRGAGNAPQLSGAGGHTGSVQEGVDVRLESVNGEDGTVVVSGTAAAESHRESSSLPTDAILPESATQDDSKCRTMSAWQASCDDEEIARKAKEEGRVDVVFPGTVTQDGCCRLVCELLKCVLYQRQQLPMTYDQMVFFQKQQHTSVQSEEAAVKKSTKTSGGLNWHRCQRTLQELDDVLGNLEALFSLSHVPRVLFMLGGSTVLPTELYEVNMEALVAGGGESTLRTSSCLRQLFRALFVADLLSDVKPVRLMATTVMALAHRDCGVAWFKPKVDFRIPTRVKKQVILLASDTSLSGQAKAATRDWENYIWFQAPVTVKGFCK